MSISAAEQLLQELGVTHPSEIDLEAIAWHSGVRVKYRGLDGCEARIAGDKAKAIISVRKDVSPGRKRFSIGHELGHWHHHRGQTLICRSKDIDPEWQGKPPTEKLADQYAADLLMPPYLFRPEVQKAKRLTWELVRELSTLFSSSVTATAIRIITLDLFPALLVCHGMAGRQWFFRADSVPERWFPQDELSSESYAMDVLNGQRSGHPPRLVKAHSWFSRQEASGFQIFEQSVQQFPGEVLTLLVPKDKAMLQSIETARSWSWRG